MSREKQNDELVQMYRDLGEIFDEEYEKRRLITPQNTAEKLTAKGYRKQSEPISCGHEKGSEWISVDERLPEKWQKCLCYYPEKDYGSKVVVDYAETDNGGFAEQFQFGKPSHWMPLPEAPKMKGGAK